MNATEAKPKAPLAVLYLPESKSRMVLIHGRSGQRYTFQANGVANGRPARVYEDAAIFAREEGDIRRNLRGIMAVCTLVGEADPLAKALSAVEAIAQSGKSIGAGGVKAQLLQVQAAIAEALTPLEGVEVRSTESASASTDGVSPPDQPSQDDPTIDPSHIYTHTDLHALSIDELRTLAKARGVSGVRSRAALAAGVLAKQADAPIP